LLTSWYGGGPAIARRAVTLNESVIVEVYPLRLTSFCTNKAGFELEDSRTIVTISKGIIQSTCCRCQSMSFISVILRDPYGNVAATVGELRSVLARELKVEVPDDQTRVWRQMKAGSIDYSLLSNLELILDDARLTSMSFF
jgi:hypothetical protein